MSKITNQIKDNNVKQLEYISKDMAKLASRMRFLNASNPSHADDLGSAVVEASFFVNAYGVASTAFRKMVTDLNEGDGPKGDVLHYIFSEMDTFREEIKAKAETQEEEK